MSRDIVRATPQAAPEIADLHARCFDRPWPEREFASLLHLPGVQGFLLRQDGRSAGFALLRQAADEAEILTIGIVPDARGEGAGRQVLAAAEAALTRSGAVRIFLEVSTANAAGRALYDRAGYSETGRRKAYYADGTDALVLEKWLRKDGQDPG
jgi:ribosomal-protein-alanine N-acetyltransferase